MGRKAWIGVSLAAAVLLIGWFLFRPERLIVNRTVSEAFPATSQVPQALLTGQFTGYAHPTEGTATIYQLEGKRILRLTNFKTSNGPDVHVILVAARDAEDDANFLKSDTSRVELGALKGNEGDQNYAIPKGTDLAKFQTVSIYCERFNANFGAAPLQKF